MLFLSLAAVALTIVETSAAQPADEVRTVIVHLFDGMRAGDSTSVRVTLHPDARLQSTRLVDGRPVLQAGSMNAFVDAVGSPREAVWDERIWDLEIRVDGPLAQAWMQYAFFLGDDLSHCGVNAMHLVHDGAGWKIIQIIDTRRTEGCEVP